MNNHRPVSSLSHQSIEEPKMWFSTPSSRNFSEYLFYGSVGKFKNNSMHLDLTWKSHSIIRPKKKKLQKYQRNLHKLKDSYENRRSTFSKINIEFCKY